MLPFTDILKFKKSIAKLRGHLKGKEKTILFTKSLVLYKEVFLFKTDFLFLFDFNLLPSSRNSLI